MKCPECKSAMSGWTWKWSLDHKGIVCSGCDKKWYSESFVQAAIEAERKAIKTLLETAEFPSDAVSEEEHKKHNGGEF